jgi:hypothetical protein
MVAACVALLLCTLATNAVSASAADAPPPSTSPTGSTGTGVSSSFSVAPTGTDPAEPSSRPNLSYSLAPGGAVQDSVTVWNYSDIPLDFDLYASDAYNNKDGAFDVLPGGKPSTDAGTWVTLAQNKVTVPAHTSLEVPIAVTVPAGAQPGDHTAGVIASSKTPGTDAEGHHVVFDRRTGTRLYLRVTGPVNPALVVEDVSTEYHAAANPLDGSVDVTYKVRNTGNVRLGAHQHVEVKDLFGSVDERKGDDIPELLPGSTLTYHEHFTGVPATFRVSAEVTVTPFAPKSSDGTLPKGAEASSASASAWAIPWTLLLVLVLIVAAVVVVRRLRARGVATPKAGTSPAGATP